MSVKPLAVAYEELVVKTFNFSVGPSALPNDVLKTAKSEMLDWHGQGLSVMEMNTQNQHFLQIAKHVKEDIKKLLSVPDNFSILFYPGD